MNLLAGMEKFGFDEAEELDILKDDKKVNRANKVEKVVVEEKNQIREEDLIIDKKIECPICSKQITYKATLTTKLKRLEPDSDLRPNFEGVDELKYGVILCHGCGYAALTKFFEHITPGQRKMVRAGVCDKFKPQREPRVEVYDYDYAVDRHKLALMTAMAKRGRLSEKSFICLRIAWLRRAELEANEDMKPAERVEKEREMDGFYRQAYDGFTQVLSTEMPPFCGMDAQTVELMIANMAMHFEDYEKAAKLVAELLTSAGTNKRIKDKCMDLKPIILQKIKEGKK